MQLKRGSKLRLEMDEDSSMEQKTWQVYSFGKRNVFRLHLNVSREAFFRISRERSFHVDGQKRRGHQQWRVRNLETESIRSSEYRRVSKLEDGHRDEREQYP